MKKIKYKKVSYDKLFYFSSLGWKVQDSISGNIRKAFFWENIRKAFFWENTRAAFFWGNIRKAFFWENMGDFHFPKI